MISTQKSTQKTSMSLLIKISITMLLIIQIIILSTVVFADNTTIVEADNCVHIKIISPTIQNEIRSTIILDNNTFIIIMKPNLNNDSIIIKVVNVSSNEEKNLPTIMETVGELLLHDNKSYELEYASTHMNYSVSLNQSPNKTVPTRPIASQEAYPQEEGTQSSQTPLSPYRRGAMVLLAGALGGLLISLLATKHI